MKKFLAILLSMGMVFSLVACGSSADSEDTEREENKEVVESTVEEVEETTEESTESVEVENEEVSFVSHPTNGGVVVGDYWYYEADATGNGETKWFVYDLVADEVIGESDLNLRTYTREYSRAAGFSGRGFYAYELSVIDEKNIIDVCTGEVLVSLNENQEFITGFSDGYALVCEQQTSFDGNTYSIGMINHKGEWVLPFTSGDFYDTNDTVGIHLVNGISAGTTCCGNGTFLINYDNGEKFTRFDGISGEVTTLEFSERGRKVRSLNGDELFCTMEDVGNKTLLCGYYNMITGEKHEMLYENVETFYYERDYSNNFGWDEDAWVYSSSTHIYVCDKTGVVAEYDLSKYTDYNSLSSCDFIIVGDKLFVSLVNESGLTYICPINTDGSMEFEPLDKVEGQLSCLWSGRTRVTEEKIVSWGENGKLFIYDITTKELVNTEMPYVVTDYIPEKDMLIVEGEHPEYGAGAYWVSTDDLETLINPLEK